MMPLLLATAPTSLPAAPPQWWMWIVYLLMVLLGVLGSAVFSGFETAIYSMSRLRLIVRQSRGERAAIILRSEISDAQRTISTLLISSNLGNFLASFALTAMLTQLLGWGEMKSIVVQALLLTPLLFVFAETIPKEICRARADVVAYPLAPLLRFVRYLYTFTGILWFFQSTGQWLSNRIGGDMSGAVLSARARIAALIEEGVGHGTLSARQTDIVDRALSLRQITAERRMIPWHMVQTLNAADTLDTLRRRRATLAYARYPVMDDAGAVLGVVDLIDLIAASEDATAGTVCRSVPFAQDSLDARTAIALLRKASSVIGIVGTPQEPKGIITLRGLVEPLMAEEEDK